MSTAFSNQTHLKSNSPPPPSAEDEINAIDQQLMFINNAFKWNNSDLERVVTMLRSRFAAEDAYITALIKAKKAAASSNESNEPSTIQDATTSSVQTFQHAVKLYENGLNDIIDGRQKLRDALKLEIDKLVQIKESEDAKRKKIKARLSEVNINYSTFRTRDIIKLQKTYIHKCEELKLSDTNWQKLQLQHAQQQEMQEFGDDYSFTASPQESTDGLFFFDQHKKGMAEIISQMKTRAVGSTRLAPLDQNKQNTKVVKMKKDITDANSEYREGILTLESLRKRQSTTVDEMIKLAEFSIKSKTSTVKTSLQYLTQAECVTLGNEKELATKSYTAVKGIDINRDAQIFTQYYHSKRWVLPKPVRYENYYMEGKCKEVLFGGDLESYAVEHNAPVPVIVTRCIEAVETLGGFQKEGIYRVSGRQANVDQLKHLFEMDEDMVDIYSYDVSTFATVLKTYFRELKRPLFELDSQTKANYMGNISRTQRLSLLESKLAELSFANRSTLYQLIFHLAKVNEFSHTNKMHIQNLGVIFKPAIFHDFKQLEETTIVLCPDELFEDLIVNYSALFHNAESHAQRINDAKIKQALPGQKLYNQGSQSNLLYSLRKQPQGGSVQTPQNSRNMLLTQPMNPPKVQDSNNNSGNNSAVYYSSSTPSGQNAYYSSQNQQQQQMAQQVQQVKQIQPQAQIQQAQKQQYQQQQQQQQSQQYQQQYQQQQQQQNQYHAISESTNSAPYSHTQRKASLIHSTHQNKPPSTPTVYQNSAGMGSNSRLVPQGHRIDSIDTTQAVLNNTGATQAYSTDKSSNTQYNGGQYGSPMISTNTVQTHNSGSSASLVSGNMNSRAYYNNNSNTSNSNINNQASYPVESNIVSSIPSTPSSYYQPTNYKKATHLEISTRPKSPMPPRQDSLGQDTPRSNSSLSSPIVNNDTDFSIYYSSPSNTETYTNHV